MANPSYVEQMNVDLYSDKLSNVVVLGTTTDGGHQVLMWDNLSAADQEMVEAFVTVITAAPPPKDATQGTFVLAFDGEVTQATVMTSTATEPVALKLTVDGVDSDISIDPTTITTLAALVAEVTTAVKSANVTVEATDKGFSITSKTLGSKSTVNLVDTSKLAIKDLTFKTNATAGTDAEEPKAETALPADAWDKFQTMRSPNGAFYSEVIPVRTVLTFSSGPLSFPKEVPNSYYDAKDKLWRYKNDGSPICA